MPVKPTSAYASTSSAKEDSSVVASLMHGIMCLSQLDEHPVQIKPQANEPFDHEHQDRHRHRLPHSKLAQLRAEENAQALGNSRPCKTMQDINEDRIHADHD